MALVGHTPLGETASYGDIYLEDLEQRTTETTLATLSPITVYLKGIGREERTVFTYKVYRILSS